MTLSLSIGITSFLLFCFLRTKWEVVYMGRTKLKGMSLVVTIEMMNATDE